MRHSNQSDRGRRLPIWAAGLLALAVAGCRSSTAASGTPTPAPTPAATPDQRPGTVGPGRGPPEGRRRDRRAPRPVALADRPAIGAGDPRPYADPRGHPRPNGQADAEAHAEADREAREDAEADQEAMTTARRQGGRPGEDVSDLDKRIIEHLQQDGRRPFTQIAADLGGSQAAVPARTHRLGARGSLPVVG